MRVRALLSSRVTRIVAAVVGYVIAALAVLGVVVWAALTPAQRADLAAALGGQLPTFVVGALLAVAGLAVLLVRGAGAYPAGARRLAGDVRLVVGANPAHRLDVSGPPELAELAAAVNDLAERRQTAEQEVAREVSAARADVEQERNQLAAVMADLSMAVLVCSRGGRIVLYNSAARSLLGDDPALGLGRSVFGIVDRDLVAHALDRVSDGSLPALVSTTVRDGQLLQVRVAPVRAAENEVSGFVVLLEDTGDLQAQRRRDAVLRALTESTRAATGGIRAAVEALLDYPDMAPEERTQFLDIVRQESERLGEQVERWAAESAGVGPAWVLTDMAGEDLLAVLRRELERGAGVGTSSPSATPEVWVGVDSHALVRAVEHLVVRLHAECGATALALSLTLAGRHARLEVTWAGAAPLAETFREWLEEPLEAGAAACVREVLDHHDAEVWAGSSDDSAHLRLLLPVTDSAPRRRTPVPVTLSSRPEFYDFDLFDLPEDALGWHERRLSDLAYTVFDMETTGFHPTEGDQILAIGGVHVVGGRLRRHESFERLVNPGRSVPAASAAVHGITTDMVRGEPPLEEVLPLFSRFAEDMVLVGHNVGFDMSFLRASEDRTGVRFSQPVLDTLLLDAALHPDHEQHSLEAIAERLGVDVIGRHTALGDALVTGEVFVRLLGLLQERGITTLGAAIEAARATYQARLDATLYGTP